MIIGVRHGEVYNPDHVIYAGLPGYGLSDLGREQAASAAEKVRSLGIEAIYCSPLQRAVETATLIGDRLGLPPVYEPDLTEWKFWGRWAGRTWEELREEDSDTLDAYLTDPGQLEGAENLDGLTERIEGVLEKLDDRHPEPVLVVSHLEPLRAALRNRLGLPTSAMGSIDIPPGGVVQLAPEPSLQLF